MELQAFEVQVCAKAETRGLEMAFLVAVPWAILSVISELFQNEEMNCFRANQMGFKQVFDNLTVKHLDALSKQIQS